MRHGLLVLGLVMACPSTALAHDDELSRLHRPVARDRHAKVTQWLHEAGVARAEGRFAEAAARLDSVARIAPEEPALARCLAQIALDRDQPEQALAALGPARADERDPRVVWLRVDALARLARLDDAAALADVALTAQTSARIEHVLLRARIAEQRPSEGAAGALRVLDAGLARWPGAWPLQERAIVLEQSLGRTDAALARLDGERSRHAGDAAWLVRRGDVLAAAARVWEARAEWTEALALLESRARPSAADRAQAEQLRSRLSGQAPTERSSPSQSSGAPR